MVQHTYKQYLYTLKFYPIFILGDMAEWSKALVLGTNPKGRGFEPHCRHEIITFAKLFGRLAARVNDNTP
jgi:hypothetical protein